MKIYGAGIRLRVLVCKKTDGLASIESEMNHSIYQAKLIKRHECDDYFASYYCGYTQEEVASYVKAHQAKFYGDHTLEVTTPAGEIYYINCMAGSSFHPQLDFIISNDGIVLINARGNLYKFNLAIQQNLSIDSFASVLFDNTQSKPEMSPYLQSFSSSEYGLMAIIDRDTISLIHFDGVLWRHQHGKIDTLDLKPVVISKDKLIVEDIEQACVLEFDINSGSLK